MTGEAEKILKKFTGKLVGNKRMQDLVCSTMLIFPKEIINFVCENTWFVSSFDDSWGFVLRGDELKRGKFLVFLGDELFEQDKEDQRYTIAHEIGHVVLGHRNSIMEQQPKSEVDEQEKEAHQFSLKYLA